jgi:hypothetical protein
LGRQLKTNARTCRKRDSIIARGEIRQTGESLGFEARYAKTRGRIKTVQPGIGGRFVTADN